MAVPVLKPYRSKVLVEEFDIAVDDLQREQLVVVVVDGTAEVERRVPEEGGVFELTMQGIFCRFGSCLEVGFHNGGFWNFSSFA